MGVSLSHCTGRNRRKPQSNDEITNQGSVSLKQVKEKDCVIDERFGLLNEYPSFRKYALVESTDVRRFVYNPFSKLIKCKDTIIHVIPDEVPFENLPPGRAPGAAARMNIHTNDYPYFLADYINKEVGFKLKLELSAVPLPLRTLRHVSEVSTLISKMKYLNVKYIDEPDKNLIKLAIKEDLGHTWSRGLRMRYSRRMVVRYCILKNSEYVIMFGPGFMLFLRPPDETENVSYDPAGNNGERPVAIGTYTRMLNANSHLCLEWKTTLWRWENLTANV